MRFVSVRTHELIVQEQRQRLATTCGLCLARIHLTKFIALKNFQEIPSIAHTHIQPHSRCSFLSFTLCVSGKAKMPIKRNEIVMSRSLCSAFFSIAVALALLDFYGSLHASR